MNQADFIKIPAAFDLETTGLDVKRCDIIELALVPLKPDFTPSELPAFTARIKADHPENSEPGALQVTGLDPSEGEEAAVVAENLKTWLRENRIGRIHPVGHNIDFDLDFFREKFPELAGIFSGHGRDSMRLALAVNDIATAQTGKPLFNSVSLKNLKAYFKMDSDVRHRAYDDALDAARLYRHLMEKLIINL